MIKNFCMKKIIIQFFIMLQFFVQAKAYNLDFFSRFNDCLLEEYIKEALVNNHNLLMADRTVERFRHEIMSAYSAEFPSLSASANYFGTHVPNNDYNIFLKRNSFVLPFRVNYEPDFLLKTKDKINKLLSKLTKQSYEKIVNDTERDYYLSALDAKKYGIIDEII